MAKAKAPSGQGAIAALDYLARPDKHSPRPVCVAFGDEPFLKSEVLTALRAATLSDEEGEFSAREFIGEEAELRSVLDEVATVGLFGGGRRFVVVRQADKGRRRAAPATKGESSQSTKAGGRSRAVEDESGDGADESADDIEVASNSFVSRNRQALEDYVARPSATGVLALEVNSWPSNTRLFKLVAEHGRQIDCKTPSEAAVLNWLQDRVDRCHRATFAPGAGERLIEIVGPHLGGLDQEMAKLAMLAMSTKPVSGSERAPPALITSKLIEDTVGGWRAKVAWDMIDAAAAGDARNALQQLDRLILAGEHPVALMGQIAWRFRQLAAAARIAVQEQAAGRRVNLRHALEQVGVKNWQGAMEKAEGNLRQLGARRAARLYHWLLEADLDLKGSSSSGDRARLVLEQLFVRISRQLAAAPSGAASRNT